MQRKILWTKAGITLFFLLIFAILAKDIPAEASNQAVSTQQQQLGMSPAEPPVDAMIAAALDSSLYELDWVLETKEFKKAKNQEKQEEILERSFLDQKKKKIKQIASKISAKKVFGIAGGLFLGALVGGVVGFLAYKSSEKLSDTGVGSWTAAKGAFGGALAYYLLVWGMMGLSPGGQGDIGFVPLAKKFMESYSVALGIREVGDAYTDVELMYARKYYLLKTKNPKLLAQIKEKLSEMRNDTLEAFMYYKGFVKTATSIPVARGTYKFDEAKFDKYFEYYPPELKRQLRNLSGRLTYFSRGASEETKLNFPIYFVGIPGSGKTHGARGIAEVIGAPMARVALDGATIEEVIGTPHTKTSKAEPGRLLTALSTMADVDDDNNYENGILFIDEFDRLLNADDAQSKALLSFMLKMLDPTNRKYFSPYLNTEVKLPTLIILAGNYEIKDEALANRFQIIRFSGFDIPTKIKIVNEKLLPEISKIYDYTPKDFNAEELKRIEHLIRDDKSDKGLRYIELGLILYIEEKRLNSLFGEIKRASAG